MAGEPDHSVEQFQGTGQLLSVSGQPLADVDYAYQIDRTNRVWSGMATSRTPEVPLSIAAGPAILRTELGQQGPVHFRQRRDDNGVHILFTGRGSPPGE